MGTILQPPRRLLWILAVVLGLLLLTWLLFVPRLLRWRAVAALEAAGLHPVTMDVPEVGLFSAQVKYVMVGRQPGLTVGRVWISYSPLELLRGRVKQVELQGIDLSPPLSFSPQPVKPAAPPQPAPMHFQHLTLKDARLHLPADSGMVTIPLEAEARENEQQALDLKLIASIAGTGVSITGTADRNFNHFAWQLKMQKIAASVFEPWTGKGPLRMGDVNVTARGTVDTTSAMRILVDALEVAAPAAVLDASNRTISADVHLTGSGSLLRSPAGWDITIAENLGLRIGAVSLLADLPPVNVWSRFGAMTLRLREGTWTWEGKGAVAGVASTRIELQPWKLDKGPQGLSGTLKAELNETQLSKNRAMERIMPRLVPWNLSGRLRADAQVAWQHGEFTSSGHLVLKDAAMVNTDYKLSVTGVEGSVSATQLWPLQIAPSQTFFADYVQMGKWEIRNLTTTFSAPGQGSLKIESGKLDWAGGQLSCEPFDLSMADWVIKTTLSGRDLDLGKIVSVFSDEKAYAEGKAQLQIPITLKWPEIRFGEGYVEAEKGSILHLMAPAEQLGKWLTASDPRFGTDPTQMRIRDRMMEALRDFRIERLRADLRREGGRLTTSISLQGKGNSGQDPQVVNLNITANDLDWLLSRYLATRR